MFDEKKSIYAKDISPFIQLGVVLAVILIFNLFSWIFTELDLLKENQGRPWLITTSFVLCFALINSVLSLSSLSQNKYWLHSIISYASLLVLGGSMAYFISGMGMDEAGSYRWILLIFSMCYILFLSIVRAMKKIVTMAQQQDKGLRGEE